MIGLDSNILIRYIVQDEPAQSKAATKFVETHCSVSKAGFIGQIVLCEIVWVLKRAYEYKKEIIIEILKQILSTREFIIENSENAWQALNEYSKGNADFAYYLMGYSNKSAGCEYTITFDKAAAQNTIFRMLKT